MSVRIVKSGMLTTVQDQGRVGYQQFGVSVSGVMDSRAAALANLLVGNDPQEAVLECTLLGPQIQFQTVNYFAVTGADLSPVLDGHPVSVYCAIRAEAGQILRFGTPRRGCRAYIAFAGGMDLPAVMGSRSTYLRAELGGFQGRKLADGDVIPFRAPKRNLIGVYRTTYPIDTIPLKEFVLRVILGPQDDYFTAHGLETFFSQTYTVTPESDRMGCRLDGPEIRHKTASDIISDGIAFGAIQVPSSGKPIIMLADRQSVGGYTKIANVITADLRLLAQLKPGDHVRFKEVSVHYGQSLYLQQKAELEKLAAINLGGGVMDD